METVQWHCDRQDRNATDASGCVHHQRRCVDQGERSDRNAHGERPGHDPKPHSIWWLRLLTATDVRSHAETLVLSLIKLA